MLTEIVRVTYKLFRALGHERRVTRDRAELRRRKKLPEYREILKSELKKRKALSPKYSMRDFAKDLGLTPSHLCYVLQGKRGLSGVTAEKISTALGFVNLTRRSFRHLVLAKCARSSVGKRIAAQALKRHPSNAGVVILRSYLLESAAWRRQINVLVAKRSMPQYARLLRRAHACGITPLN